jgi:outer membrane lipoprotein SlyB
MIPPFTYRDPHVVGAVVAIIIRLRQRYLNADTNVSGESMKRFILIIGIACITLIAGCAAHRSKPVIDPVGVDMTRYEADVTECEQIATQVEQKAGAGAAGGAVVGGLIGAIVGGRKSAVAGAGVGAVSGGARGTAATQREKSTVVKNCLRNRGYKILN